MYKSLYKCCLLFKIYENYNIIDECPICFETKKLITLKQCKHKFCNNCIKKWFSITFDKRECPLCRRKIIKNIFSNYI